MRHIVFLSVLAAILLMAGPIFGDLAWDYQWFASKYPESCHLPGDCFSYSEFDGIPVRSVSVATATNNSVYICDTRGLESSGGCFHATQNGVLDAGMPAMAEFRIRLESVAQGYDNTATVFVRDEDRGYVLFSFGPNHSYYKTSDGYSVFRMLHRAS